MSTEAPAITLESPDPAVQAEVDSARIVANQANDAFDQRLSAADLLVVAIRSNAGVINRQRLGEYSKANATFVNLLSAAETLMPPRATFEKTIEEADESLATPEVWGAMSREQQAFTLEARTALAAGPLKEYGVTEGSLRVVMAEVDGQNKFALIHTEGGVDIGNVLEDYDQARSYNKVMSRQNDNLFQVEIAGGTYDARQGMTAAVYDAKVADARVRGEILPDSQALADKTGDVWTWTMLTGESLTADGGVPIRGVSGGEVDRHVNHPDYDYRYLRVCPAVEIPDLTS